MKQADHIPTLVRPSSERLRSSGERELLDDTDWQLLSCWTTRQFDGRFLDKPAPQRPRRSWGRRWAYRAATGRRPGRRSPAAGLY